MNLDEALFYLVREMGGLGIPAKDDALDAAIEHVREHGLKGLRGIEITALVMAAKRRNRMEELDEAVERHAGGPRLGNQAG